MALAGFAGLITLLGHPDLRADRRLSEIRFRSMVELSLFLVGFCLLPFVPIGLGWSEAISGCVVAYGCSVAREAQRAYVQLSVHALSSDTVIMPS
ncbi:MAG TPA: hypothetical protein VKM54_23140 [Myxococcota bacterium]|nr:hypothetical protein [Myxococcota bacterium]